MKNILKFILLIALLLLVLTACSPVSSTSGSLPTKILQVKQQSENVQPSILEAQVSRVEILLKMSYNTLTMAEEDMQ